MGVHHCLPLNGSETLSLPSMAQNNSHGQVPGQQAWKVDPAPIIGPTAKSVIKGVNCIMGRKTRGVTATCLSSTFAVTPEHSAFS